MKEILFAIVGLGAIGHRHKHHIEENVSARLVAVCDIRSREEIGLEEHIPLYKTIEDMLVAHPEIDAVSIATPNNLHTEMALKVMRSKKYPVLEKPIALTVEDAQRVIDGAKEYGIEPFFVMQNRFSPPSEWLKEVMDKKLLGDLHMVVVNCFWNRDSRYYTPGHWHGTAEQDGGVLFTQFSHYIDLLLWILNFDVKITSATMDNLGHVGVTPFADSGVINFRCGKAMGVFNFTTGVWQKNFETSFTLIGSKGTVKVAGQYMDNVVECNIDGYEKPELAPCNAPNNYGAYKGSAANHGYVIDNVVNTLNGKERPCVKLQEGLDVIKFICEAMHTAKC